MPNSSDDRYNDALKYFRENNAKGGNNGGPNWFWIIVILFGILILGYLYMRYYVKADPVFTYATLRNTLTTDQNLPLSQTPKQNQTPQGATSTTFSPNKSFTATPRGTIHKN